MITDDCLDYGIWVGELVPKTGAVDGVADGRAAFVSRVAVDYVFGGECEVVETCLGCYFYTAVSGFAEEGDSLDCGEVHDVEWKVWCEVSQ